MGGHPGGGGLGLKYAESIGDPRTRLPLVDSVWSLYPGAPGPPRLFGPAMLEPTWPAGRPRGGALPLRPGAPGAHQPLAALLVQLLGPPSGAP